MLTYAFGAGTGWTNVGANFAALRPTNSAAKNVAGTYSNFISATYDYDGKYGLGATVRRDASYRFVDDNRWGTFWSVGGGWNIDKENFMKNVSFVNQLKLRSSYGVVGVADGIGLYAYQGLYGFANNANDPGISILKQSGGKKKRSGKSKKGGFLGIGALLEQAVVPFGLLGIQQSYGKSRRKHSGSRGTRRRR